MEKAARWITGHSTAIVIFFTAAAIVCAALFFGVKVNYDMTAYLPEDAESTVALQLMQTEFDASVPNARVMVPDLSLTEALEMKEKLREVDGVDGVMWLDDAADVKLPLETLDATLVRQYYRDGAALYDVTVAADMELQATDEIYGIIGDEGCISGNAANIAYSRRQVLSEVLGASSVLVPVIILILILTTSSWIAPLLFLLTIGVAVLINMGTNIFFKDISYITQSVSPILQLAVSLDYAIFLLTAFERLRKTEPDVESAMVKAIMQSFVSIAASAATTVFGFLALVFMRFGIGSDLGLNLVKGVTISYISVVVFLPALSLKCVKLLDITGHKRLLPDIKGVGRALVKVRIPALILVLLLVVPCYLAQSRSDFLYGNGDPAPDSRYGRDTVMVNESFGESTALVLLVPRGDPGREAALCSELEGLEHVTTVVSYATTVGSSIPSEFLSDDIVANFYSEHYARIILYTDTGEEGADAFGTVEQARYLASKYYDESYSCGQSANLYDIMEVITGDTGLVNGLAIGFIFLTLLTSFKSLTLPFILIFVIESAIWINLSTPYFMGTPLVYMGYLVINTVQLGATIDYAILLTDGYTENRGSMGKLRAVINSIDENFISLLTSGLILSLAGLCLQFASSMEIVKELGLLLCRGTLLSMTMVLIALPALLITFDALTAKLSKRKFCSDCAVEV
ncbi:MAG: MMPL family transporter [Candidatus Limivicinus sp.]|nr:MMPL family transporter [Candidatus Limivicinus sp.]